MRVVAAGRTDAGVHATSQIVHFDAPVARPQGAWIRGVNAHLPRAAAVLWCVSVPGEFHARFAAIARHYTYLLLNRPERPGLGQGRVGWHHAPLDAAAMQEGAQHLAGRHDFSSFRAAECQARTPMRNMHEIGIVRTGEHIVLTVRANAFLHHMVRNIAGVLIAIGSGERSTDWTAEVLAARDRTQAGVTAPPGGLYLAGIRYTPSLGLPSEPPDPTMLP